MTRSASSAACTDMMRVTLRAVAEMLFGDDLGDAAAEINRVFPTILSCLASRVRPPLWLPTANNRRLRPALVALDRVVQRLIATKRRRLAEGGPSDAQLRDEVMTMMIAGHETTALG